MFQFQHTQIFLFTQHFQSIFVIIRCSNDLQEDLLHFQRGRFINLIVNRHNSAKDRLWIGFISLHIRFITCFADCNTARCRMLDRCCYDLIAKFTYHRNCTVQVIHVIERNFFTVQLLII